MLYFDEDVAIEWEKLLIEMISNNSDLEADDEECMVNDVEEIQSFEDASICTTDRGLIVYLEDKEIHITIQAYTRR